MAYHPNGTFSLPCTVSYLPNNLSCLENQVSIVKFNEVSISNYSSGEATKVSLNPKTAVFQASLVRLHEEIFLVVASSDGTHVYMNGGLEMKFFLPIGVSISEESNEPAYACGIASPCEESSSKGFIFTGTSNGTITAIQVPSASGEGISFHSTLSTIHSPVIALAASSDILASGNDNGDIFAFTTSSENKFARKCKFTGSGHPCTAIGVQDFTVFAGFSLGNIRVYNTLISELTIEVTAHARSIYGLCVHPCQPLLASCSEDQHLHVWSTDNMDLLSAHVVENRKLTGVAFLPRDEIGVSAYDSDEVILFSSA